MKILTAIMIALSQPQAGIGEPDGKTAVRRNHGTLPPTKYDHPYAGATTIKIVRSDAEMRAACNMPVTSLMGCARVDGKVCVIHMRDDATLRWNNRTREIVLRHETGHCNGWVGHDGARAAP